MDRLAYLAMSGAKALEQRQHALANNLANASTDGFRADLMAFRSVPVRAEGTATTRVFAHEVTAGFNAETGTIRHTGNPQDVALRGAGWFAVQAPDGGEYYTRNGSFAVGADGVLKTQSGLPVIGDGGSMTVPENARLMVGSDGTVSATVGDQRPQPVGRLKLVNPPADTLIKKGNGLMQTRDEVPAQVDENVTVVHGSLEGSNVNVVESMVGMIAVAREFEMQMRMIQNAESNDARAATILSRNA